MVVFSRSTGTNRPIAIFIVSFRTDRVEKELVLCIFIECFFNKVFSNAIETNTTVSNRDKDSC